MQIETLQVFCDIVRLRSYSRAAEQNGVSQSAASQAVAKIEKDLGVMLLDRSRRPFTVTPEGQAFYEACVELLATWERAKTGASVHRPPIEGGVASDSRPTQPPSRGQGRSFH